MPIGYNRGMSELADQDCEPCRGGAQALDRDAMRPLVEQLGGGWEVVDGHHLTKSYAFVDFATALAFVNRVGALADEVDHHPDIHLSWGKVQVVIWTHDAGGLTRNDFVWAAKADRLLGAG